MCQVGFAERATWYGTKMNYYMPDPARCGCLRDLGVHPTAAAALDRALENRHAARAPAPRQRARRIPGPSSCTSSSIHWLSVAGPAIDIYEAQAETVPGIIAHQSAMKGGELMKVPQYEPKV
jgi:hypothetical protein